MSLQLVFCKTILVDPLQRCHAAGFRAAHTAAGLAENRLVEFTINSGLLAGQSLLDRGQEIFQPHINPQPFAYDWRP